MMVKCLGDRTELWGRWFSNWKMSKTPMTGTTRAIRKYRERIPWWCPKKGASQPLEKKAGRRHFSVLCRFYVRGGGQTITIAKQKRTISASWPTARTYKVNMIGNVVLKAGFMRDLAQFLFTSWKNLFYLISTRVYRYWNSLLFQRNTTQRNDHNATQRKTMG